MDIKQLYYFATVVQEKNISRAARKLHISQPPLSTCIKTLERELGCILFVRGSRSIYLTDAGRLLYSQAQTILNLYEDTIESIKDISNGVKGTLRIGVISSTGNIFLSKIACSFHRTYPDLRFELVEGNTYELMDRLNSRDIEIALVRSPFTPNEMDYFTIDSEPLAAFGTSTLLDTPGDSIPLSALAGKPLIVYRRWLSIIKQEFEARDIKPYFLCINDDARTSIAWVEEGMGIGIMPKSGRYMLHNRDIQVKDFTDLNLCSHIVCMFAPAPFRSTGTRAMYQYMLENYPDALNTGAAH